jgi:hypothetical protein
MTRLQQISKVTAEVERLRGLLNVHGRHRNSSPFERMQIQRQIDKKVAEYLHVYKDKR